MSEIKLHTSTPPVYSFPIFANLLSIISAHKNYESWFFSNFIQLNASPKNHTLSFYDCWAYIHKCPLIITNSADRWMINEKWSGDITSFLIDAINKNTYIYFFIDEAKLSNSSFSRKYNAFTHDVMVHGYNLKNKEFYIAGAFASGKYVESTCTFAEMQCAYENTDLSKDWLNGIQMIRLNTEKSYDLYIPYIKEQMSDFLYSKNSALKIGDPSYYEESFGLSVYDVLRDYLVKLLNGSESKLLIKPFHFLLEHKKCMVERVNYFDRNDIIKSKANLEELKKNFKDIHNKSLIHRNLFLKYMTNGDPIHLPGIITELTEIQAKEKDAFTQIIELI